MVIPLQLVVVATNSWQLCLRCYQPHLLAFCCDILTLESPLPAAGACVSEYRVTVLPVDAAQRSLTPPKPTSQFSVNVSGLANGAKYKFFVAVSVGHVVHVC